MNHGWCYDPAPPEPPLDPMVGIVLALAGIGAWSIGMWIGEYLF